MTNLVTDIRDIKGFVPVPFDWRWLWVLVPVVLIVAAVLLWLWWRKRRNAVVVPVAPPSPYELAIRALRQLRDANLPVEKLYTQLSDIVRQYIEGRFGLHAPERTTEEFLAEAELPIQHMTLLSAFLQECDLVKFAKLQPVDADRQRAFAAAERFVEETRPQ